MAGNTYSFLDVQAAITGPGGAFSLGAGAGVAEEGITVSFIEEKDTMVPGASGEAMHSLNASKAARITVRLLKTSPTNALLSAMYNFQANGAATWGQNTIVVSDVARGDVITAQQAAFAKQPDISYSKEGAMNEWTFNCGICDELLGVGVPDANA